MALSFAILLAWPALRDFYEIVLTHESTAWVIAAVATAVGIVAVEATARFAMPASVLGGRGGDGRGGR
jgi:hypothetical protein